MENKFADLEYFTLMDLLNYGYKHMYKERKQEWNDLVTDYGNGGIFASSIVQALEIMEDIDDNIAISEISNKYRNTLKPDKFENTLDIVARFSKKGVEFYRANKKLGSIEKYFIDVIERENSQYEYNEKMETLEKEM